MAYDVFKISQKLIHLADIDVANGGEPLTNLKLQKLLYYEQGFHLAMFGSPLFNDDIEAWAYGPVVPDVYHKMKEFQRNPLPVSPDKPLRLTDKEDDLFAEVYESFRGFSAIGLVDKTHGESPWKNAVAKGGWNTVISQGDMAAYFKTQLA